MPANRNHSPAWRLLAMLLAGVFGGVGACGFNKDKHALIPGESEGQAQPMAAGPNLFRDMTADSGIDFTFRNGQEAKHLAILESLGGGVALIDYDGDGLLDVFVTGGGYYGGKDNKEIKGHPCKLYKNLGNFKFKDVTAEVGLDRIAFYAHGAAVADYDRDGWSDLLVTGWGGVALFHNEPDGKGGRRFVDVTEKAGLTDRRWSTSAAWADLDGDGWPDLYICHYVDWSFAKHPVCQYHDPKLNDVCPPKRFDALPNVLYRNNGKDKDGQVTFTDVSEQAGLYQKNALKNSKALGVIIVNVKDQGLPDIYVADDTMDNLLYINRGGMKFDEMGFESGTAVDDYGKADGSMGAAAGDYDGSGRASLFCTNYQSEYHALYRNDGKEQFTYATKFTGIAAIGQNYVAFGTAFIDVDNDGWEDLMISNGHVIRHPQGAELQQPPVLLLNGPAATGKGRRFETITHRGGSYFQSKHVGRGVAFGDLDNDGRTDMVISHLNEPVAVLRNIDSSGNHWLGVELAGKDNRDVVGAKLTLELEGRTLTRFMFGGGSYLSASDPRRVFGLGQSTKPGRLTVTWPSGEPRTQHWDKLEIDRYHRLVQGEEKPQVPRSAKPSP